MEAEKYNIDLFQILWKVFSDATTSLEKSHFQILQQDIDKQLPSRNQVHNIKHSLNLYVNLK